MNKSQNLFQTWYDSSAQLSDAIQCYYNASLALENLITTRSNHTFDRGTLNKLFAAIRINLEAFSSRKEKLARADAVLKQVLNRDTKSVPIQSLPNDVLLHIFLPLTRGRCNYFQTRDRMIGECLITNTTVRITHVCADWRRLTISTPSLWSHLDVVDSTFRLTRGTGLTNRLKALWLERSSNTPLSLQVSVERDTRGKNYEQGELTGIVSHFGNIRSLGIQAYNSISQAAVLTYWMENGGDPRSLQELFVAGSQQPQKHYVSTGDNSRDLFESLGRSLQDTLRVLRIRNTAFQLYWILRSHPHFQLTHLEIVGGPPHTCPTISSFDCITRECPGLQVLKLESLNNDIYTETPPGNPVYLTALERLEIINVSQYLCSFLLGTIHPGPNELSLLLERVGSSSADPLRTFLSRSNVTKLYVKPGSDWFTIVDSLNTITNLRALTLNLGGRCGPIKDGASILSKLLPCAKPGEAKGQTYRWPQLDTLWLIEGQLDACLFENILEAHHVKTLILSLTNIDGDKQGDWDQVQKVIWEDVPPNAVDGWYNRG